MLVARKAMRFYINVLSRRIVNICSCDLHDELSILILLLMCADWLQEKRKQEYKNPDAFPVKHGHEYLSCCEILSSIRKYKVQCAAATGHLSIIGITQ